MLNLKHDTEIWHAETEHGTEIPVLGCPLDGHLWFYQSYEGPFTSGAFVFASSFESALETVYDEAHPIEPNEVYEAYGFDSDAEFRRAIADAEEFGEWPELSEGYTHQSNATGTGIVWHGYDEALFEVTTEWLRKGRYLLSIGRI